ncbi:hypothetical protein MGYG_06492 [Nannizzia gypsea CBS 118893]|uniref:Uncharacterized protein n=1 Tax=Arthroderma gypseum (strain ATCC MYA-4604 / CBS 118893) TaxID=535722 RepID=E4UZG4_ARTGP|nr:hypothetical protein MGYG_06492 [Nannizzia gypsea CBS 118893]EFR03494.1 hypothetical protein MGYG_06492 [Nannizzia gypsea CBS 118893]
MAAPFRPGRDRWRRRAGPLPGHAGLAGLAGEPAIVVARGGDPDIAHDDIRRETVQTECLNIGRVIRISQETACGLGKPFTIYGERDKFRFLIPCKQSPA